MQNVPGRLRLAYVRHVVAPALRMCGPRLACGLAKGLGQGVFHRGAPGRARAEVRLRAAFGNAIGAASVAHLAAAHYGHLARFWAEALFVPRRMDRRDWRRWCHVPDEEQWRRLADRSRPLVVVAAYHGNIAVAACALARLIGPVHVVFDRLAHPAFAAWQAEMFRRPGLVAVDRREASSVLPIVMAARGVVLLVGEHHRRHGAAVPVDFLGARIRAYPTIGRLAAWYGAAVAAVTCERHEKPFEFTLKYRGAIYPENLENDPSRVVRASLTALERAVLTSPEQYLWSVPLDPAGIAGMEVPRSLAAAARPSPAALERGSICPAGAPAHSH